jgi:hypothetical protein
MQNHAAAAAVKCKKWIDDDGEETVIFGVAFERLLKKYL